MRERVREVRAEHDLPGIAVGAAVGSEVVLLEAQGEADLEAGVAMTAEAPFEIASVTKLFTAELVMLLVQDGVWTLEAELGTLLPDLPEAWHRVRLEHILAHQSGLPSYNEVDGYWQGVALDRGPDEILALVTDLPLAFEPGERMAYDNTGFFLLGLALERATGASYGRLIEERIAAPLGMRATRVNDHGRLVPGRVRGYGRGDTGVVNRGCYSTGNTFSAGVLLSSAHDLTLFGAAVERHALLDPELRDAMRRPRPSLERNEDALGYRLGLAWHLLEAEDGTVFEGHNGSIVGFAAGLLRLPAAGVSVAVLANGDWWGAPHLLAMEIARELAG